MSLNYLATRFQCSLAVEHAGHALRRADRVRLRRSVRAGACWATSGPPLFEDVWSGGTITRLREELNAGGSKFCGDCSLKLPLKKDDAPPVRPVDAGRAALADVHRVHGRLQHLVQPGGVRAGDRHHAHAPGRHARFRAVPPHRSTKPAPRCSGSTSSTTARRSCTSAPWRCASTSRRAFRTSTSIRARTASRSPKSRPGVWSTPASTR